MSDFIEAATRAIEICKRGIGAGESPFGAVIARRDGGILSEAHNTVRSTLDPTAHAEINAIRDACRRLGSIDLSGHVIVSTCEPCPMCAAAIHWAKLDAVIFGASIADARAAGFNELSLSCRSLLEQGGSDVRVCPGTLPEQCRALFDQWRAGPHATPY